MFNKIKDCNYSEFFYLMSTDSSTDKEWYFDEFNLNFRGKTWLSLSSIWKLSQSKMNSHNTFYIIIISIWTCNSMSYFHHNGEYLSKHFESFEHIYLIHRFSFFIVEYIDNLRIAYLVVLVIYNKLSEYRLPSICLWIHQTKWIVHLNPICMREALV